MEKEATIIKGHVSREYVHLLFLLLWERKPYRLIENTMVNSGTLLAGAIQFHRRFLSLQIVFLIVTGYVDSDNDTVFHANGMMAFGNKFGKIIPPKSGCDSNWCQFSPCFPAPDGWNRNSKSLGGFIYGDQDIQT